jgi:hypothetical protein
MICFRFAQKSAFFASCLLAFAGCGGAKPEASTVKAVEDISSMTQERDGSFRVVCNDGRIEYRSAAEVRSNRVCERGGGGGDTSGILRCIARDNDGRDPWILARFLGSGQMQRFDEFVFSTFESCQNTVRSAVTVGWDTSVFCTSRDRDGRNPWAFGVIASGANLAADAIFGDIGSCQSALARARVSRDFLLTCTSRDRDGRSPWSFVTVNAAGQVQLQPDTTWNTLEQCLSNL